MGCYDTVKVPCPACGVLEYFQSKSGDCVLAEYKLSEAPSDVLADVNRHAPYTCINCNTVFKVELTEEMVVIKVPRLTGISVAIPPLKEEDNIIDVDFKQG